MERLPLRITLSDAEAAAIQAELRDESEIHAITDMLIERQAMTPAVAERAAAGFHAVFRRTFGD
jgi:hypothetical protein